MGLGDWRSGLLGRELQRERRIINFSAAESKRGKPPRLPSRELSKWSWRSLNLNVDLEYSFLLYVYTIFSTFIVCGVVSLIWRLDEDKIRPF